MKPPLETVRIDRWLMAARFYKTRSQAAKACEGRKVKVNGQTAKPHKMIRVEDEITIHHRGRYRDVKVLKLEQRGLPPAVARELYYEDKLELSEAELDLIRMVQQTEKQNRIRYKGRPTKKERRKIDRFKEDFHY